MHSGPRVSQFGNAMTSFYTNQRNYTLEEPQRLSLLASPYSLISQRQNELIESYKRMHGGKLPPRKRIIPLKETLPNSAEYAQGLSMAGNSIYTNAKALVDALFNNGLGEFRFGNFQNSSRISSSEEDDMNSSRFIPADVRFDNWNAPLLGKRSLGSRQQIISDLDFKSANDGELPDDGIPHRDSMYTPFPKAFKSNTLDGLRINGGMNLSEEINSQAFNLGMDVNRDDNQDDQAMHQHSVMQSLIANHMPNAASIAQMNAADNNNVQQNNAPAAEGGVFDEYDYLVPLFSLPDDADLPQRKQIAAAQMLVGDGGSGAIQDVLAQSAAMNAVDQIIDPAGIAQPAGPPARSIPQLVPMDDEFPQAPVQEEEKQVLAQPAQRQMSMMEQSKPRIKVRVLSHAAKPLNQLLNQSIISIPKEFTPQGPLDEFLKDLSVGSAHVADSQESQDKRAQNHAAFKVAAKYLTEQGMKESTIYSKLVDLHNTGKHMRSSEDVIGYVMANSKSGIPGISGADMLDSMGITKVPPEQALQMLFENGGGAAGNVIRPINDGNGKAQVPMSEMTDEHWLLNQFAGSKFKPDVKYSTNSEIKDEIKKLRQREYLENVHHIRSETNNKDYDKFQESKIKNIQRSREDNLMYVKSLKEELANIQAMQTGDAQYKAMKIKNVEDRLAVFQGYLRADDSLAAYHADKAKKGHYFEFIPAGKDLPEDKHYMNIMKRSSQDPPAAKQLKEIMEDSMLQLSEAYRHNKVAKSALFEKMIGNLEKNGFARKDVISAFFGGDSSKAISTKYLVATANNPHLMTQAAEELFAKKKQVARPPPAQIVPPQPKVLSKEEQKEQIKRKWKGGK